MTAETRGMLIGAVGIAIFSLTLPLTRIAVVELDPFFIAFGRAAVAGCIALVPLLLERPRWPDVRQLGSLVIVALGAVYGFPLFTSMAMQTVPSSHGGIVLGILPLATSVVAALRFGEWPSLRFWVLAVIGAALVVAYSSIDGDQGLSLGDAWLMCAVVSAAVAYGEGGRLARSMGAVRVISWAVVLTLPVNIALALWWMTPDLLSVSWPALASFGYLSAFSMYIGFFFWYRGIAMGGIARVGQVQLLQPFMTLIAGFVLLGEDLTLANLAFAVAVLAVVAAGRATPVRTR